MNCRCLLVDIADAIAELKFKSTIASIRTKQLNSTQSVEEQANGQSRYLSCSSEIQDVKRVRLYLIYSVPPIVSFSFTQKTSGNRSRRHGLLADLTIQSIAEETSENADNEDDDEIHEIENKRILESDNEDCEQDQDVRDMNSGNSCLQLLYLFLLIHVVF